MIFAVFDVRVTDVYKLQFFASSAVTVIYKIGQKFGVRHLPPPQKRPKTLKFRRAFRKLRDWSRISPDWYKISSIGKRRCKL